MKKLIVILALLSTSAMARESDNGNRQDQEQGQYQGQQQSANAGALAVAGAGALAGSSSNGSVSTTVTTSNDYDAERIPVSTAISPSVGSANDCQIATPASKAFSILILSVSGTTGVTYNDLCYAYKRGQFDVADKLMCLKSQDYAAANPAVCAAVTP